MSASLEVVLFLKDVALFQDLTNAQLVEVARLAEKTELGGGSTLFRKGDPSDALYLVRKGKLRVTEDDKVLAHLGPGECAGEMGLLSDLPRSATVDAVLPCHLLRFERAAFHALLDAYPEIGRGLLKALVKRLVHTRLPTEQRAVTSMGMLASE